jgi:hypothetical protein
MALDIAPAEYLPPMVREGPARNKVGKGGGKIEEGDMAELKVYVLRYQLSGGDWYAKVFESPKEAGDYVRCLVLNGYAITTKPLLEKVVEYEGGEENA